MDHKNLQFPPALAAARRSSRLSQKALALACDMDQSYVCGVERGRRPTPKPEALERLVAALGLPDHSGESNDLRWAAAHDRVLQVTTAPELGEAVPLVAAALRATRYLAPKEAAGLLNYINRAVESRLHLRRLSSVEEGAPREEAPM